MKKLVIEPLEEDFIVEYLNASELDDWLSYYSRKIMSKEENFMVGKIIHLWIQQELMMGNWTQIADYYIWSIEQDKNVDIVYNAVDACRSLPKIEAMAMPVDLLIEYWKYLIKIWWSVDAIYNNTAVEIKAYANANMPTEDDLANRYQLMIYAIWLSLDCHKPIKNLEWWIFNKATSEFKVYNFNFDLYNSINSLKWRIKEIMSKKI